MFFKKIFFVVGSTFSVQKKNECCLFRRKRHPDKSFGGSSQLCLVTASLLVSESSVLNKN